MITPVGYHTHEQWERFMRAGHIIEGIFAARIVVYPERIVIDLFGGDHAKPLTYDALAAISEALGTRKIDINASRGWAGTEETPGDVDEAEIEIIGWSLPEDRAK